MVRVKLCTNHSSIYSHTAPFLASFFMWAIISQLYTLDGFNIGVWNRIGRQMEYGDPIWPRDHTDQIRFCKYCVMGENYVADPKANFYVSYLGNWLRQLSDMLWYFMSSTIDMICAIHVGIARVGICSTITVRCITNFYPTITQIFPTITSRLDSRKVKWQCIQLG